MRNSCTHRIPYNVLTLTRIVDECKPLPRGSAGSKTSASWRRQPRLSRRCRRRRRGLQPNPAAGAGGSGWGGLVLEARSVPRTGARRRPGRCSSGWARRGRRTGRPTTTSGVTRRSLNWRRRRRRRRWLSLGKACQIMLATIGRIRCQMQSARRPTEPDGYHLPHHSTHFGPSFIEWNGFV